MNVKINEDEGSLLFMIKKILRIIKSFEENTNYYNSIFIRGALSILKDPEFIDFNKVKNLVGLLDDDYLLMEILQNYSKDENINVRIGSEIYGKDTNDLSLISTRYRYYGNSIGSIGIIGFSILEPIFILHFFQILLK